MHFKMFTGTVKIFMLLSFIVEILSIEIQVYEAAKNNTKLKSFTLRRNIIQCAKLCKVQGCTIFGVDKEMRCVIGDHESNYEENTYFKVTNGSKISQIATTATANTKTTKVTPSTTSIQTETTVSDSLETTSSTISNDENTILETTSMVLTTGLKSDYETTFMETSSEISKTAETEQSTEDVVTTSVTYTTHSLTTEGQTSNEYTNMTTAQTSTLPPDSQPNDVKSPISRFINRIYDGGLVNSSLISWQLDKDNCYTTDFIESVNAFLNDGTIDHPDTALGFTVDTHICRYPGKFIGSKCSFVFNDFDTNRDDAIHKCKQHGGSLLQLDTETEATQVSKLRESLKNESWIMDCKVARIDGTVHNIRGEACNSESLHSYICEFYPVDDCDIFDAINVICYKKIDEMLTFEKAIDRCSEIGGSLVSHLNEVKNGLLTNYMIANAITTIWIGYTVNEDRQWIYITNLLTEDNTNVNEFSATKLPKAMHSNQAAVMRQTDWSSSNKDVIKRFFCQFKQDLVTSVKLTGPSISQILVPPINIHTRLNVEEHVYREEAPVPPAIPLLGLSLKLFINRTTSTGQKYEIRKCYKNTALNIPDIPNVPNIPSVPGVQSAIPGIG